MTMFQQNLLRRRLTGVRKADLADAIIATTCRIGGTAALLAAIADAQNERARQRARRRATRVSVR